MKLSEWARQNGVAYLTAWRWFRAGKLPVPAIQTETGTILVTPAPEPKAAVYARVSSSDQKADLARQAERLRAYCKAESLPVAVVVEEVGSGLNGRRRKLRSLLRRNDWTVLVVEHRDRLARFGFEIIESAVVGSGRSVRVTDDSELQDDLVADVLAILTSVSARLHGRRSAASRAKRAVEAMR